MVKSKLRDTREALPLRVITTSLKALVLNLQGG